jgi:hypothetical protein
MDFKGYWQLPHPDRTFGMAPRTEALEAWFRPSGPESASMK